jgi:hypothetical protein
VGAYFQTCNRLGHMASKVGGLGHLRAPLQRRAALDLNVRPIGWRVGTPDHAIAVWDMPAFEGGPDDVAPAAAARSEIIAVVPSGDARWSVKAKATEKAQARLPAKAAARGVVE